ncbi:DNA replication initiation factor cdc45 [Diplocarpon rosae]|nr:DNA replication initiation factor cdc45 [Diplocarpon rosae]
MGIRHLIAFLRPYAVVESLEGLEVIIDGPSFAHHMFYISLRASNPGKNALEATGSYRELVDVAVAYLDGLRTSSAVIKKIYFDGFLPPGKLETRLSRLQDYTRRLSQFYEKYKEPCRSFAHGNVSPYNLFGNQAVPAKQTSLQAPPFIVPAIIEALSASDIYGTTIEVVPGEADLHCAQYLKEHGGIVLTNDSDLLVHDLGPKGVVCFFHDIESQGSDERLLHGQVFQPVTISQRLELPNSYGLRSLAFEMARDSHGTFRKLLGQAKSLKAVMEYPQLFKDFLEEYNELPNTTTLLLNPGTRQRLQRLDPRISEYVLQFRSIARITGQSPVSTRATSDSHHVFLPFLRDCPVRTSAWEASTATRQLAYGLVNLIQPEDERVSIVFEHRRQLGPSKGRGLQVATLSEIPEACGVLTVKFTSLQEKLPAFTESQVWIALAMQQDIEWSEFNHKTAALGLFMQNLGEFEYPDESEYLSWDVIHFFAQLQASLYSLRMLNQISSLVSSDSTIDSPGSVHVLTRLLSSLPALVHYPDIKSAPSKHTKVESVAFMDDLKAFMLALNYQPPTASSDLSKAVVTSKLSKKSSVSNASRASKKKRKRDQFTKEDPAKMSKSSNPFDILAVD